MNRFISPVVAFAALVILWLVSINAAPEKVPNLRERLKDPSPTVRKQAALTLAEANDADAIPVLIDLLAELSAEERRPIEEYLTQLAGEWTPPFSHLGRDAKVGKQRRDTWRKWWRDTDGKAQLAVIHKHTPTLELRRQMKALIAQLGDDAFSTRESADKQLLHLGRAALPPLREAQSNSDPEVARRARHLVERLELDSKSRLSAAAVRLLALRKPEGATAALLAYLPFAEEENLDDEIEQALAALARDGDKLDAALRRALKDELPLVRAFAGEALAQGGGDAGRAAVHKLLGDDAPLVRLRIAVALVRTGDKDGVPVLIDLLAVLPDEQVGEAEEALSQLAGDAPPKMPQGTEGGDKNKRRDAWADWWKVNGKRVDLRVVTARPQLGLTLLCDTGKGRVFEIDRRGKERWSIDNLRSPGDAVVLPGQRVLIAEFAAGRVSERDFKGKILWQKKIAQPIGVQRLANGNTFLTTYNGSIVEVDRAGKEIYAIHNIPGGVRAARRSRQGTIFYVTPQGECVQADTTGKRLKSFNTPHRHSDVGGLELLANGRLLISPQEGAKLMEYNAEGKKILEVEAPQAATATGLPNGHFLVASYQSQRVYELDRCGKIVWEQKGVGHVYRARRR